jgi:dethiobiotin synthetase
MIFITGTGTGVGKTTIAQAIIFALRARGIKVGVFKPVETGCLKVSGRPFPKDADLLLKASQAKFSLEEVCPYRFLDPLCPAEAASKGEISLDLIMEQFQKIRRENEIVIVEGAGGLLVPLTDQLFILDLIRLMNLPILLVSEDVLGTINHTLLSIWVARAQGLKIKGVILNQLKPWLGLDAKTNLFYIKTRGNIDTIAKFPYLPELKRESLQDSAEKYIALERIFF